MNEHKIRESIFSARDFSYHIRGIVDHPRVASQHIKVLCDLLEDTLTKQPEQYEIGIYGKAYDGPGKHRAYTHKEQPDNFGAGRLGKAARAAHPGGDLIDYGLSLLRQLQEQGFGVFEIGRPEPPQGESK